MRWFLAAMWYPAPDLTSRVLHPSAQESDESLLGRLGDGDHGALRTVYRQHHEVVRSFARRLLGVPSDAEELVQETFLALPSLSKKFRGDSSFRTFVLGVTAQHARNFLRSKKRRKQAYERFEVALPDSVSARSPEDLLHQQQLANQLLAAMNELDSDERIAFVLSEVEERSSHEVAEILQSPASTVRARVARARLKLRTLLSEGASV